MDFQQNCYTPYSNSSQWCVVESKSGLLFPGVRIENASFPLTISATQNAIFCCLSENEIPKTIYIPESFIDHRLEYLSQYHDLSVESSNSLPDGHYFDPVISTPETIKSYLDSLMQRAIVGESDFRVACILELEDGSMISGINIEYPDWQMGLCAERVAMSKALSVGMIEKVKSIHITASNGSFISPCGACRQVMVEHLAYTSIQLYHPDGTASSTTAAQLLPAFFNGSSLRK